MSERPWDDPGVQEWITHVRKTLVPMLDGSRISVMLGPDADAADVKFAVELGLSILMDKPILVLALKGRRVPDKLRMIADEIVFVDDMSSEQAQRDVTAAVNSMLARFVS